jgi:enamine deaminase RidA (YjgF/YER057c/UK114 family)
MNVFKPRYFAGFFSILILLFPQSDLWAMQANRIDIVPPSMKIINERYHYSPAVRAGDTLYVAGQVGRDADMNVVVGKEAQLVQAFENLKTVLEAASADFDMRDLALVVKVKDRYFTGRYPAWTGVGVTALSTPGLEFEIKATAYLGK